MKQLVEKIVELLESGAGVRIYGPKSTVVSAQDRKVLNTWSAEALEHRLQELLAESIRATAEKNSSSEVQQVNQARLRDREAFLQEQTWTRIFSTPLGNKVVVDNEANRNVIANWLHPGEALSPELFVRAITESPALLKQLVLQSADTPDPHIQKLKDRDTFSAATRKYGFGDTEANFALIREVLGSGFNEYQVGQAVQSGAARVSPATQEELATWAAEAGQERQHYLLSQASHSELKQAARSEAEQGRAQAQRQHTEHQVRSRAQVEAGRFPVLPETSVDGTKLDGSFFKRLADSNIQKYKQFCSKYGFTQITERLNQV